MGLFAPSCSSVEGLSPIVFVGEGAEVLMSRFARGLVGEAEDMVEVGGVVVGGSL